MTQTNTTQNKEELIKTIKLIFDRDLTAKQEFLLSKEIDKSISQAHQSGIEEERKRIRKIFIEKGLIALMEEFELIEKDELIKKVIHDFKIALKKQELKNEQI